MPDYAAQFLTMQPFARFSLAGQEIELLKLGGVMGI
jgi:hypothetical protein